MFIGEHLIVTLEKHTKLSADEIPGERETGLVDVSGSRASLGLIDEIVSKE